MQDKETIESIWAGIEGDDELLEGTLMAPSEIEERQRFSRRFNRAAKEKVLNQNELVALTLAAWEKDQAKGKTIHFPSGKMLLAIAATLFLVFGLTTAIVQYQHPVNWMTPQVALWGDVKGPTGPDTVPSFDESHYTGKEVKQAVRAFQLATQEKIDRKRGGLWQDHRVAFHLEEKADGLMRARFIVAEKNILEQDYPTLQDFLDSTDRLSSQLANILMEPETEP